ncbi:PadR family transcriptional regulator [Shouchella clausii]|nr:PadR family transcriptional regulator [Shouchella clausii]AST98625.1 PadR family transcriptional regulator [Shouchella clausii]MCR1287282.1 PadR family transcriptional regulator [Shouchella clausii]MEB5471572.1 PadR family transcriptional regulator [Shouchella clausii]QNM45622.1 PadR family transcriptional regulator [Shouchella clausii]WQG94003.1 PadR family transcriptional regulator [Shouchella clausii]
MDINSKRNDWSSQITKGMFELAILLLVAKKPMYGYEITKKLRKESIVQIANGSIYPILRRMTNNRWLTSYQEDHEGRSRKYYIVTEEGKEILNKRLEHYQNLYLFLISLKEGETSG